MLPGLRSLASHYENSQRKTIHRVGGALTSHLMHITTRAAKDHYQADGFGIRGQIEKGAC